MVSEHSGEIVFESTPIFLFLSIIWSVSAYDHIQTSIQNLTSFWPFFPPIRSVLKIEAGATNQSFSQISWRSEGYNNDPLFLQASDHSGMQLTGIKLNGTKFQQWSRCVKIALRTWTKLALIDVSCKKPPSTSLKYEQWIRCDSMVVSWLLNSIVPELSEAFLCTSSAKELWTELSGRFR